jgi:hypothetical protein
MRLAEALVDGKVSEAQLPGAVGAFGDIELALQNVEWRREVNYSWLEFSRWGIQQIILIGRLYYIKNPICRRMVDVCAAYVFARGVEVTTNDDAANEILDDFFTSNKEVFGHAARKRLERAKDTDGNIFFVFFPDREGTGSVKCRTLDPTEIEDIKCDPEDADCEWYFHRVWVRQLITSGVTETKVEKAWYPALNYNPTGADRLDFIDGAPVLWASPVYHRKVGTVGKWRFGLPRLYPALDWAKEARRFLEACASIRQSLSQIALQITTSGGTQALQGLKNQFGTTVGPEAPVFDTNPPAVAGGAFASGPGTKIEAFKTQGAGFDPEGVRQYKLMACMCAGIPETFLGDVSTGNLATATSLDRPTETIMIEKQEEWVEDLTTIAKFVLETSDRAPSGRLREALAESKAGEVQILEATRVQDMVGRWRYVVEKDAKGKPKKRGKGDDIKIQVNFPAIREGDIPALVTACVTAMTLGNKGGQVTGIDEKVGMKFLYALLGIEDGDEIAEEQYPEKDYDPDRTTEELPPPIPKLPPAPAGSEPGAPTTAPAQPAADAKPKSATEAWRIASRRITRALRLVEAAQADQ